MVWPKAHDVPAANKMWNILRERSKQVRHAGDWSELLDEASGEVFYYNASTGNSQWECPDCFKTASGGDGSLSYSI